VVASGLFDGLAHVPRRHGVRPVRVTSPGRSGGQEATSIDMLGAGYQAGCGSAAGRESSG
jgi:hypothetical protein